MSYKSKFVGAGIGVLVMAIVASRQLFLFVVSRDSQGFLNSQAGKYHLWFAFSAGIAACVAGTLMFRFFQRYERSQWTKVRAASMGAPLAAVSTDLFTNSTTRLPFDPIRWALANPWLAEGQADDRPPMNGSVRDSSETTSVQRAFARRSHQAMFKKWSQARHD